MDLPGANVCLPLEELPGLLVRCRVCGWVDERESCACSLPSQITDPTGFEEFGTIVDCLDGWVAVDADSEGLYV